MSSLIRVERVSDLSKGDFVFVVEGDKGLCGYVEETLDVGEGVVDVQLNISRRIHRVNMGLGGVMVFVDHAYPLKVAELSVPKVVLESALRTLIEKVEYKGELSDCDMQWISDLKSILGEDVK